MDNLNSSVKFALKRIFSEATSLTKNNFFYMDYDPKWPSPCQDKEGLWRPLTQSPPVDFRGLSNALETEIHPNICEYFNSFWSGSIETTSKEGHVSLIQLWNRDDFDRLVQNLLGHAVEKKRKKHKLTIFFATTDWDSELFLSIENSSGHVLLEEPGKAPLQKVEDNLPKFLNRLTPSPLPPRIY